MTEGKAQTDIGGPCQHQMTVTNSQYPGEFYLLQTVFNKRQRAGRQAGTHSRYLAVSQSQQTIHLSLCCLIIANWHGFGCFESPRTRTIRFGPEGTPGTWLLLVLLSGGVSPNSQLSLHRSKSLALSSASVPCAAGPARQPDHSAFDTHDNALPGN